MRSWTPGRPSLLRIHGFKIGYALVVAVSIGSAIATPQFARQTQLPCRSCHSHVPRLNEAGQRFYANGFRLPGHAVHKTVPAWIELATMGTTVAGSKAVPLSFDDNRVLSGDRLGALPTIYHAMYAPVSKALELYAIHPISRGFSLQAGKIAPMSQTDPELEVTLSTPSIFAPLGAPAANGFGPFAPSDGVLGLRVVASTESAMPYGDGWKLAATIPMSSGDGEAPKADLAWQPKGVFLEAYRRKGMDSLGLSAYAGKDGRQYYGALGQHKLGNLYLEGGAATTSWFGQRATAFSGSLDVTPDWNKLMGVRVDILSGQTSLVPFASFLVGGGESALRLQGELIFQNASRTRAAFEASFRF